MLPLNIIYMEIICIYKTDNECIAFIAPFYGGDNIHECKIVLSNSLRDSLENHKSLIDRGRDDLNPLEFTNYDEAHRYAFSVAFKGLDYDDYH
jgi:hypothetical protein